MAARTNLVDRKLRKILLEEARKQGLSASTLAERLSDELGYKIPSNWEKIERIILETEEIDARELATILLDLGVQVPEDKWIEIVSKYQLSTLRRL